MNSDTPIDAPYHSQRALLKLRYSKHSYSLCTDTFTALMPTSSKVHYFLNGGAVDVLSGSPLLDKQSRSKALAKYSIFVSKVRKALRHGHLMKSRPLAYTVNIVKHTEC